MSDGLIDLLADEAIGVSSGIPPGSVSLGKLLFAGIGTSSSGGSEINASFYYKGEMVDIGDIVEEDRTDLAEEVGEKVTRSRKRTIKERFPHLSEEEVEEVDSEYIDRIAARLVEGDDLSNKEKADAASEFVSTFLHGTHDEKLEIMTPVFNDMDSLP